MQDYVMDRLKKLNTNPNAGFSSFQLYIMKEIDLMFRLVTEIKTTLNVRRLTPIPTFHSKISYFMECIV